MKLLTNKFIEVVSSVLPIVFIVAILAIFFVDVSGQMLGRFVIGAILLIIGLTIFLFGIDIGMEPIGKYMGETVALSQSKWFVLGITFIIGFSVTVAEPDLLILARQISDAAGGQINNQLIVLVVSIGVGVMISAGVNRILKNFNIKHFFLSVYGLILLLTLFSGPEFIAMAFDASGATTGALTTPFILALGASVSARKGGKNTEENSFGLVGAMSTGPILAVLLLSLVTKTTFQGQGYEYIYTEGIFSPFLNAIGHTMFESMIALVPIILVFLVMNIRFFHIHKRELKDISKGVLYTVIGLTLFLIGVNQGFMDMGYFLGVELAANYEPWLPLLGLIMGLVVVLAEPAVHVLGEQVEMVTGGYISHKILLVSLSAGVGIAVAMSMLRIIIPELHLWYFLLPGFTIAVILAFFVPDIFTGIAFDAGGVASGPMTATFILAFSQGVASYLPQADVLADGFGVIAMVAMVPVIMIQILGLIYKIQTRKV